MSRAIDRQIAEKVFGEDVYFSEGVYMLVDGSKSGILKNYSTDIVAAWKVVEEMRKKGIYLNTYTNKNDYHVEAFHPDEFKYHDLTTDKSAPMAICKAALKAIQEVDG